MPNMTHKALPLALASLMTMGLITACQQQAPSESAAEPSAEEAHANTDEHSSHDGQDNHDMAGHDMDDMSEMGNAAADLSPMQAAYQDSLSGMHQSMMGSMSANDADIAFAEGMLAHHRGAIAMAEIQLEYGKDDAMRALAENVIAAQQAEIDEMTAWLAEHPDTEPQENTSAMQAAYQKGMDTMHTDMMASVKETDPDMAFAKGMLPHHQGAVAMAETQLEYGKDDAMRALAQNVIDTQQAEITQMQAWIEQHQ